MSQKSAKLSYKDYNNQIKRVRFCALINKNLYGNFEDEKIKKIIEELEESESGGEMSTIAERLEREYKNERKEGIARGLAQGIRNTIEKLIEENMSDDFIKRITGYDDKQIEEIRNELRNKKSKKMLT